MKLHNPSETGFALLMTLIVVGVVISVGLSILDLSIKQVRLSTNARDSEIAFHAANAGMECAQFWRRNQASRVEIGESITPGCFGSGASSNIKTNLTNTNVTGDGEAFKYDFSFTWGTPSRCSTITLIVASSTESGTGVTITGMDGLSGLVQGYPDGTTKTCVAGARCTVASVRGYNRACDAINAVGTIEREVLLQY